MSFGNRIEWLTLDPTIWAVQNGLHSVSNLSYRWQKWFSENKKQLADTLKTIPWNKRYKRIWNIPLSFINWALVPVNAALWLANKFNNSITAGRRLLWNSVKFFQKTVLWQNVVYKPLVDMTPSNWLDKTLAKWLKIRYFWENGPTPAAAPAPAPNAPAPTA